MSLVKIINKKYPNQPADLLDAKPLGLIAGFHKKFSNNQSIVAASGGTHITIRNRSTGTYAAPAFGGEGAPVVGSYEPYRWHQTGPPGGWIATTYGRFFWFLTGPEDDAPIVLRTSFYHGDDGEWKYEPTTPA